MNPLKAARQFVRHTDRTIFDEYWNLIDPESPTDGKTLRKYRALRRSVMQEQNVAPFRTKRRQRQVLRCVPKEYRDQLKRALNDLLDAEHDKRSVHELCAFLIGRELGRRRR